MMVMVVMAAAGVSIGVGIIYKHAHMDVYVHVRSFEKKAGDASNSRIQKWERCCTALLRVHNCRHRHPRRGTGTDRLRQATGRVPDRHPTRHCSITIDKLIASTKV